MNHTRRELISKRSEPVATDTVYSYTPAVDDGSTSAQIFAGTKIMVTYLYGIRSDKKCVNTLEYNIRKRASMDKLISSSVQVDIRKLVQDTIRD